MNLEMKLRVAQRESDDRVRRVQSKTQELKDTLNASAERIQDLESQLEEKSKHFEPRRKSC